MNPFLLPWIVMHIPSTDGRQDQRPFVRCHGCQKLLPCYRGRLLKTVTNMLGTWEQYDWRCAKCFALTVEEALR